MSKACGKVEGCTQSPPPDLTLPSLPMTGPITLTGAGRVEHCDVGTAYDDLPHLQLEALNNLAPNQTTYEKTFLRLVASCSPRAKISQYAKYWSGRLR